MEGQTGIPENNAPGNIDNEKTTHPAEGLPDAHSGGPPADIAVSAGNIPSSLSTTTMEVHHHPDLHHKRKKFKEYFLEFLMIFLAVTLGFFAESLRESIGDSSKEHEYMQSLLNDLRTDSLKMEYVLADNHDKSMGLDTLMKLSLQDLSNTANRKLLYHCVIRYAGMYSILKSNDATMLQLKNSGGLRVIKKDHAADSIARYDYEVKIIYASETLYNKSTETAIAAAREILDYSVFYDSSYYKNKKYTGKPFPLLTDDPKKHKEFFNAIDYEKGAVDDYLGNIRSRMPFLKSLIQFLKREYNLE